MFFSKKLEQQIQLQELLITRLHERISKLEKEMTKLLLLTDPTYQSNNQYALTNTN